MNTFAGAKNVDFMMTTGDNIYPNGISSPGNYAYTDRVMSSLKKKNLQSIPVYVTAGNHDCYGDI